MAENIVFIVDEKIETEGKKFNFIDAGIHENIMLTNLRIDVSPTNKDYLEFTFANEDGEELKKTEWQPTLREGDKPEVLVNKCKNQASRVKHIMTRYLSEEQTQIEYNYDNWLTYAKAIKAKLDPVKGSTKVRIKAIYDDKGYVTLPNYKPFLESMAIPLSDTKLSIRSNEKMTKNSGDVEVKTTNPFEPTTNVATPGVAVSDTPPSDLPF